MKNMYVDIGRREEIEREIFKYRGRGREPCHLITVLLIYHTYYFLYFMMLCVFFQMLQVLAHAAAWALTDYTRVILLEDNMLVMENIDDLFECSGVCAGAVKPTGHTQ